MSSLDADQKIHSNPERPSPESRSKAASHSSSSLCRALQRSTHPPRLAETEPPASSYSPPPSSPRPERSATKTRESLKSRSAQVPHPPYTHARSLHAAL